MKARRRRLYGVRSFDSVALDPTSRSFPMRRSIHARTLPALTILGCALFVSPALRADDAVVPSGDHAERLMSPEHAGKIREEIHLHERRAHELEPIIARDRQARHDVEQDWAILERHAREMHGRAAEFRAYASEVSGRAQDDMNTFANELDASATRDEENAHYQHEIADRLDRAIQSQDATRDWHLKIAGRLRDWLSSNGY
jgi:hypothetical protein